MLQNMGMCKTNPSIMKVVLIVGGVSIILLVLSILSNPYKRTFSVSDASISMPYKEDETITFVETVFISIAIPFVFSCLIFHVNSAGKRYILSFYSLFVCGLLVTSAIVENLKNITGELRPDFLDRCKPISGGCTGDAGIILKGRKSFPSGHSAISACGFTILTLLAWKEAAFPELRRGIRKLFITILILLSVLMPVCVGISRIVDGKHFLSDVICGFTIGITVSFFAFTYLKRMTASDK